MSHAIIDPELLADTLAEMESSEPRSVTDVNPFDCDVLEHNADHTLGMWAITYYTHMGDPSQPDS